jgi:hypothetical protein
MKGILSFRASKALHRMVFRAKRDPESSPAIGGIRAVLEIKSSPGAASRKQENDYFPGPAPIPEIPPTPSSKRGGGISEDSFQINFAQQN